MLKRTLLVAGLGVIGIAGVTGAAEAQADPRCYPVVTAACPAGLTLNDTTATRGQSLTATATGLDPATSASGVANSTPVNLGTKTTDANGSASFTFTVPNDFEAGNHTVVVTGVKAGAPITLTANFTVSVGAASTIPRTGDDSSLPLTQAGIALLALGGGAVYLAKRRTRPATAV